MTKITLNVLALLSMIGSVRAVDIVEPMSTQEELSVIVVSVEQADDMVPQEEENIFEKYKKAIIDYVREHNTEFTIVAAALVATALAVVCCRNSILAAAAAAKEEVLVTNTVPAILDARKDLEKPVAATTQTSGTASQPNPQQPGQPAVTNQAAVVPVDSQDTNKAFWDLDQAKETLFSVWGYVQESLKTVKLDTEN